MKPWGGYPRNRIGCNSAVTVSTNSGFGGINCAVVMREVGGLPGHL